mgnify:CR=1 FL=1
MAMKECIEAHEEYYGAMYKGESSQEDVGSPVQDEETQSEDAVDHAEDGLESQEIQEETAERASNSNHESAVNEVFSEEMNTATESSSEE